MTKLYSYFSIALVLGILFTNLDAFAQSKQPISTAQNGSYIKLTKATPVSFIAQNGTYQSSVFTPLAFKFGDNHLKYISISNQGWLSFDDYGNEDVVGDFQERNLKTFISPYLPLKDNAASGQYEVTYQMKKIGNTICLITDWTNGKSAFQALLFDNGNIEFRYSATFTKDSHDYMLGIADYRYYWGHFPITTNHKPLKTFLESAGNATVIFESNPSLTLKNQ